MLDMTDLIKHILLCLHPLSFYFMTIKEFIDVSNGYIELYDWLGNFIGISYYLLIIQLIRINRPVKNSNF